MTSTAQIAKQLRDVHFGGNWTDVNLRDQLADVTWEQATTQSHSFHTIAELVYHMDYFVDAVVPVLQGEALEANDKYSFDLPTIASPEDWQELQDKTWADVDQLAGLIESFPEEKLRETFFDQKYGSYRRNFLGIIEHCHYHLGQIVVIKQLIQTENESR